MTVKTNGTSKCSNKNEMFIIPFLLQAQCSKTECRQSVSLPLATTGGCDISKELFEEDGRVVAYLTGWEFAIPSSFTSNSWWAGAAIQAQTIKVKLENQIVRRTSSTNFAIDFDLVFSLLHTYPNGIPDWSNIEIGVEILATPDRHAASTQLVRGGLTALSASAGASTSQTTWSTGSGAFFFNALTGFEMAADYGNTALGIRGASWQNIGLDLLGLDIGGGVHEELFCEFGGNGPVATQTSCAADYVAVFADTTVAERATSRTETVDHPLLASHSRQVVQSTASAGLAGVGPCALGQFRFAGGFNTTTSNRAATRVAETGSGRG